jgi:hypothetical protein
MTRLLKTGYDSYVFDNLVSVGLPEPKVRELKDRYNGTKLRDSHWSLLVEQANRLRRSRLELYSGREAEDILLDEIINIVKDHPRIRDEIFGHSDSERKLYPVLNRHLRRLKNRGEYDKIFLTFNRKDLPVGNPDFIAVKKRRWPLSAKISAIGAKATLGSLHDFYHQASRYKEGFDFVFLATTKWIAIQENEDRLYEMLDELGVGLIYIDMSTGRCDAARSAKKSSPEEEVKEGILKAIGWK